MIRNYIFRFLLACLLSLSASHFISAQNAPITTAATVGGAVPGTITIAITVTGFSNIGAVSLSLDYDHSVLNFIQGAPHPQLGNFAVGDNDLATGFHRVVMGWFGSGTTLPDGSTIMTLSFTYISGITALTWYDMGPSCEYANAQYEVLNDLPTEVYYINGSVCGAIGSPGTITGDNSVCPGEQNVIYSITAVENATGYNWTVPEGSVIINGENTNLITVNYPNTAISGDVAVYGTNPCGSGPSSQLAVTVNALPVANAGADFSIPYGTNTTLSAANGGSGSYAYHWSPEELLVNPDVQNPQTLMLTSTTVFTLQVTDQASFCQNTDMVTVTVTGGPLNVSPIAIPAIICIGESSQLYANAAGGSEDYTYLWTSTPAGNPPWSSDLANPLVSPAVTTQYQLSVFDGFTTINGATNVSVDALPSATISGGDTLCGNDEMTTLPVDLTGNPPWSFTYSFGSTSVFVNDQATSPYYIIASETGDYIITAIEDVHCSGTSYGTAIVRKYPIPAKPEITTYFQELISSSCCGNQWYMNGELIPGATGQTYQVLVSGLYHVMVTLNGCSSDPSDAVDIIVGVDENERSAFSIYPNPASTIVHLQTSLPVNGKLNVILYSASGLKISSHEFRSVNTDVSVDVSGLEPGLYFVVISSEDFSSSGKFVKQ
jgi:large repetitive protein